MLGVVRRNPRFRRLWFAQVITQAGDWLNRMAILALIAELGSAGAASGVGALFGVELAIRLLPTALLSPLAGPVADRLPRKALMIAADLVRVVIVLGYLLIDEPGDLPLLYALMLAQMSISIFFQSARSASVPNTLPHEELHEAYTLSAATWSTMLALGAFAGGLLVSLVGIRGVFVIDALTFAGSAWILARLALPPTPRQPEPFSWKAIVTFVELRRAAAHVRALGLAPALLAKTCWGGAGGFLVLLSIAGTRHFAPETNLEFGHQAAAAGLATGLLYCARGIGTGLGPVLARRMFGTSDASLRRQIALSFVLAAGFYSLLAVAPNLGIAFLCVAAAHMGGSTLWVCSTTWWQRHVDDRFRGRVFALEFAGMTLAFTAGGFVTGAVYDRTSSFEWAVLSTCALVLLSGVAWSAWSRRAALEAPRAA